MTFETPDLSLLLPALMTALPSALLIILGAVLLNLIAGRALLLIARRTSFTEQEIKPIRRTVKWVISIVALVLVFGAFGLNIGGMWGVLSTVLAMVAIGFVAVWSVLSNTLCTLIIMIFRPFAVGDEIEFAGDPVKGRVIDLNFIFTTLDAGDGTVMQIPNNLFFQKVLRRRHAATAVSAAAHLRTKRPETPEALPAPASTPAPVAGR
jgi:small-conductance mechanosensitive channel